MIRLRILFYILVIIIFRDILVEFSTQSQLALTNNHTIYPLFTDLIVTSYYVRIVFVLFCVITMLMSLIYDNFWTRIGLFVAVLFLLSASLRSGLYSGHARWPYPVIAFLSVLLHDDRIWVYYTRVFVGIFYFIAGISKLITIFFIGSHADFMRSIFVQESLLSNEYSFFQRLMIEHHMLSAFLYILVTLGEIAVLYFVIREYKIRWIGISLIIFHIMNFFMLNIIFFPMVLVCLTFFVLDVDLESQGLQCKKLPHSL